MNDTLSTPDPVLQLAEVRRIIEHRTVMHSCESTLAEIRRIVIPPPPRGPAPELNERGWPELKPAEGTAWERHDDPEQQGEE